MKELSFLFILLTSFVSCNDNIVTENTPLNVFNAFWKTIDERYVYFEEKQVNWDSVYNKYNERVKVIKTDDELAEVLQEIINLFKDQHLGIVRSSNVYIGYEQYNNLTYNYFPLFMHDFNPIPKFYNLNAIPFIYEHDRKKYIYLRYDSFLYQNTVQLFQSKLDSLNYSEGIILDIRNNGGGFSYFALDLAAMFFLGERVAFTEKPKSGTEKNDFRQQTSVKYYGKNIIPSTIPIIILTSNRTYSAGNLFAFLMADLPNCIIIGDKTGGGGSSIKSVYLPNSWILYYPNSKKYSSTGLNMEYGLKPDYLYNNKSASDSTSLIMALNILDSINSFK